MNKKPTYKLIDGKGRVLIPKELRTASNMDYGDIVRLGLSGGRVAAGGSEDCHRGFRAGHAGGPHTWPAP